ncbi:MAG: hypothetical protein RLZZ227_2239 [Pseudomonadota bacterium]
MRVFRTLLILSHRYIGIPLSFMFVVWFVSAFFMIYTGGMPRITPEMQIDGATPLDLDRVVLTPGQAADIVGYTSSSVSLRTVMGRPVYEFLEPGYDDVLIYADTGAPVGQLREQDAARIAGDFLAIPPEEFSYVGVVNDVDQWTLTQRADLPMHKFTAGDGLGTEVYVSDARKAVSVYTTTQSRALAWVGTIPHWLYFTSLRLNQPLWYDIVVWSSAIGCVMALLGLILGVTQFRKTTPLNVSRSIPYRGLMRWHYILGAVFGVFTLTWVFSGLLSMEPYAWTNSRGVSVDPALYAAGELDLAAFPAVNTYNWNALAAGNEIKQVDFQWIGGAPYLLASYSIPTDAASAKRDRLHQPYNIVGQSDAESMLIDARSGRVTSGFDREQLVTTLDAAVEANVSEVTLLEDYDDYYYSRGGQLPLPALRVKFDDPAQSWVYVDPERSELLTLVTRASRIERWLYNGLHSLDFAFWYHKRPLWDIGVILLLLGGLGTSLLGLYFGVRRVKYDLVTLARRLKGVPAMEEVAQASS